MAQALPTQPEPIMARTTMPETERLVAQPPMEQVTLTQQVTNPERLTMAPVQIMVLTDSYPIYG